MYQKILTVCAFALMTQDTTTKPEQKTILADKEAARVEQMKGLYVFTDSKPLRAYKYLGNVKGKGFMMNGQYTNVRDALLKRCSEQYPEADGIILHLNSGGFDFADALKFE